MTKRKTPLSLEDEARLYAPTHDAPAHDAPTSNAPASAPDAHSAPAPSSLPSSSLPLALQEMDAATAQRVKEDRRALDVLCGPRRTPKFGALGPMPGMDAPFEVIQDYLRRKAQIRDLKTLAHQGPARARSLSFSGSAPQVAFWASQAKVQGFVGGIGSGKTYSGAVKCLMMPPGTTILACAPTYVMLRDGAWKSFWEVCHPYIKSHNKSRFETVLTNGTTILWRATVFADRLRGINAGAAWIDEAGYVHESAWKVIVGRVRRAPSTVWLTSTPKGKKHWLYDVLVGKPASHTEMFHSPTRLNRRLPADWLANVGSMYGGTYKLQELEGQFIEFGGTKFKRDWFDIIGEGQYPIDPDREARFWDLAVTQEKLGKKGHSRQKDATASIRGCFQDGHLYLRWGKHMKQEWPVVRREIVHTCLSEPALPVGIEAYGGGWKGLVQDLKAIPQLMTTDINGYAMPGDKSVRAARWSHLAEDGRVHLVDGPWTRIFLDEAEVFGQEDAVGSPTNSEINDDFMDATSGLVGMLDGGQRSWLDRLWGG